MTFVRALVSWGRTTDPVKDRFSNTLFFNVTEVGEPDYTGISNDLRTLYGQQTWCAGSKVEVRTYDMADDKPRPEKSYATGTNGSTMPAAAHQVALCLSYYADRNLPRRRGRIYLGPFSQSADLAPDAYLDAIKTFANGLAGIGGVNVDWSIYSRVLNEHWRISNAWVDNSWDVVRSRKIKSTKRQAWTLNG